MAQALPGSIVYSFDADDRRAYRDGVATELRPSRRLQAPLGLAFVALGLLEIAFAIPSLRGAVVHGRVLRPNYAFAIYGPLYVVLGILWMSIGRADVWLWFGRPKLALRREMSWDETGLTFRGDGEPTRTIPWRSVRKISYVGGCVAIGRRLTRVVVPARAFPDGGGEFMIYAEDRIVGKRLLVRSHSTIR